MTTLILGASSGLGYALTKEYIRRGDRVGLAARRLEPLKALQQSARPGQEIIIRRIDVTNPREAAEALEELWNDLGGTVDRYVHCAGIGRMTPDELNYDDEEPTLLTNVMGWTACIDFVTARFERQGYGQLAAITSFAANRGLAPAPSYASTKAFQAHYLESVRQRMQIRGLRKVIITDLRPGFVATPLLAHPERLFWVLTTEKAVKAILKALDRKASVATVTFRWRLLAPLFRIAPRRLLTLILGRAM